MTALCWRCKQRVRIYVPKAGDGSVYVFSLHRTEDGQVCFESKAMVEEIFKP
jgi:hypothetical protein